MRLQKEDHVGVYAYICPTPIPGNVYLGRIIYKLHSLMNIPPPTPALLLLFLKMPNPASHASEFQFFILWAHIPSVRREHRLDLTCFKANVLRISSLRAVCFGG